ncbi:phosphoglycerate mutase [Patiriisocius marinistellae]|uniref:Phosphoglycerate mutase n=1 Tax=Patiriisocius marinistellae TaxID=2494560 RepID=A0A5J4G1G9_9FLAO|nr:histidine phosphatase family protein [Patiriisocius marinistellae]GEQ86265.1 phosphoglycerate mutase [Patiriisocius marinistellae]
MKTLYLARHAKSSWKHDVNDHQRPLKGRGKKDAPLVAAHVASIMERPQLLVSSDAVRAYETALFFKSAFGLEDAIFKTNHELYDFSGQQLMEVIKGLDDDLNLVMLVGHNHALTSIVNMLGDTFIENVTTSGFVAIQFDVDSWSNIVTGKTIKKVFPRDLK